MTFWNSRAAARAGVSPGKVLSNASGASRWRLSSLHKVASALSTVSGEPTTALISFRLSTCSTQIVFARTGSTVLAFLGWHIAHAAD
jgi:hypothetical protein